MEKKWDIVTIENIAKKIAMGPFGSSIKVSTFVDKGIPVISGQHLHKARLSDGDYNFITQEHAEKLKNANVYPGDVIFTHAGNIGQVAYIPKTSKYKRYIISQRQFYLRCNQSKVLPEYITYYFKTAEGQYKLLANSSQTGVPSISRPVSYLRTIKIPLPSTQEQRSIVHILGTLDDKIELNQKMNETLEAIARAIFKSWFVDFDPVRAKAEGRQPEGMDAETAALFPDSFEESELGMIPNGWKIVSLEDICERITDGSHFSPKSCKYGYPMASVKDMQDWGFNLKTCRYISEVDYKQLVANDCKPKKNDVLIAKDGSYLKHIFVMEDDFEIVILSSIAILRPNDKINPHILSFILKDNVVKERMKSFVSGAVLQRIVLKDFRIFKVLLPPFNAQKAWYQYTESLIHKYWQNNKEIKILSSLRDTLLPKLLSGEIRIRDIEKFIGEAV